jgi:DNA-binding IclR family transcriptional regulator
MTLLNSLKSGALSPKEIAEKTGQPLFRVRSGLRELINAEYVEEVDDKLGLTQKGDKILE